MIHQPFEDFDWTTFWKPSVERVEVLPSNDLIAKVERTLGYKLPGSYVELAKHQNGGIPRRTCHRTFERTSWAIDHIAITGISAIGETKRSALAGEMGSRFWMAEWGYPDIGVYFAGCPSAGHDMLCLDYRACGPTGEPQVIHVDQDLDYRVTFVAPTFESFIRGLQSEEGFEQGAASPTPNK